ncbi:Inositol polyphosphate 1-phosphatase isoform 1 [Schistosoma japonicum]|uniref:Inositol polyphosphate 1-phosphatase isoform 1 n=1 Tax=Schistosoma japonicum TaxID=6182 RepID=A0A4Z2CQQ8_SCHJA|nr:Inositol polyphosphate 1-phosphatase [Schistosoma japonicum]TNN06601.1 Inositol polyphosphate 1-phosphatase isoform 1 [Schistosoma japonicum]
MNKTDPLCVQLLKNLILCSEKAAAIARLIKKQTSIFQTLVQVKDSTEANLRFSVDVKTLADVLIQEVVKYELNLLFPDSSDSVFGEENNRFSCNSGKTITIQLSSKENLAELLIEVLDNDLNFANELSEICFQPLETFQVHLPVRTIWNHLINSCNSLDKLTDTKYYNVQTFGVWIDPIDSTADYAQGQLDKFPLSPPSTSTSILSGTEAENVNQINRFFENPTSLIRFCHGSLINVTILLGLFDRFTGLPIIGVVNQPFYLNNNSDYANITDNLLDNEINLLHNYGRIFWGFNVTDSETSPPITGYSNNCSRQCLLNSLNNLNTPKYLRFPDNFFDVLCPDRVFSEGKPILKLACSSVEFSRLTNLFHNYRDGSHDLVNVVFLSSSGAGFKQLCVILNEVDAFILMEPNTFLWDTCGPHCIISALGGGIVQLKYALETVKLLLQKFSNDLDTVIQLTFNDLHKFQIKYNVLKSPEEFQKLTSANLSQCCNRNGLLAYRNPMIASQILVHIALNQK